MYKKEFRHFLINRAFQLSAKNFVGQLELFLTPNANHGETIGLAVFNLQELEQIKRILLLMGRYDHLLVITSMQKVNADPHSVHLLTLLKRQKLFKAISKTRYLQALIDFSKWPDSLAELQFEITDRVLLAQTRDFLFTIEQERPLGFDIHVAASDLYAAKKIRNHLLETISDPVFLNSKAIHKIEGDGKRALLMNPILLILQPDFFKKALSSSDLIRAIPNYLINMHLMEHWNARNIRFFYNNGWQPGSLFAELIQIDFAKAHQLLLMLPERKQADLLIFAYYSLGISATSMFANEIIGPARKHFLPWQKIELAELHKITARPYKHPHLHDAMVREIFNYLPDQYHLVDIQFRDILPIAEQLKQLTMLHEKNLMLFLQNTCSSKRQILNWSSFLMFVILNVTSFTNIFLLAQDSDGYSEKPIDWIYMSIFIVSLVSSMLLLFGSAFFSDKIAPYVKQTMLTANIVIDTAKKLIETNHALELILKKLISCPETWINKSNLAWQLKELQFEKKMLDLLTPNPAPNLVQAFPKAVFHYGRIPSMLITSQRWHSYRLSSLSYLLNGLQKYTLKTLHSHKETRDELAKYTAARFFSVDNHLVAQTRSTNIDNDDDWAFRMV